jgi:hypothetical protein
MDAVDPAAERTSEIEAEISMLQQQLRDEARAKKQLTSRCDNLRVQLRDELRAKLQNEVAAREAKEAELAWTQQQLSAVRPP